ncbi:MAG TPA: chloride channel protein [Candidatus Binataceae bacterium]|nr:chloride channel protein [Candidatus Binataceae bacterium]
MTGETRAELAPSQFEYVEIILLAAAVGVLAALGNFGFRALIHLFAWLFMEQEGGLLGVGRGFTRILLPLILMSGGGLLLILNYFFPRDMLGYGFPAFLENVNLGNAQMRRRWIVLKALGAAVSLGCGASVGREGPIAQIGGAIGSALAQFRRLSADRAKVLIAAGAGAGIAATFNAPMGGMMFAQEIVLLGETELGNLTLVLIATFSSVAASRALIGSGPLFSPHHFLIDNYWEVLTYGVMGVVLGAMAAGFVRFFHATGRYIRGLKLSQPIQLLGGLALVGLIAIPLPQNLADGYPVIEEALGGRLGLRLTVALMAAKFLTSAISLEAGAPGGIFGPVFFIGAMAGASFRGLVEVIAPGFTGPSGSYALIGIGGFLSGVSHAPLTALLLLFEMTRGDWTVVLPTMIATVSALVVARLIEPESIDTYSLARAGKSLEIGRDRLLLTQLPVSSVIRRDARTVPAGASLAEVMRIASEVEQATLPVIDHSGALAGLIRTHDLLQLVAASTDLGALVNAWDLSRRNPPVLTLDANLDQAAQTMEYEGLEELPVTETAHGGKFLGLVTRHDIARAFNRVTLSVSAVATRENNIFWASGYRVSRVGIPDAALGKNLRQLELRTRFGVSVLAVQDGADPERGFQPCPADRPFKADDVIIAAGHPADLRRFSSGLSFVAESSKAG